MSTIRYSSNNSGGDWWLSDEDWHALENAGWKVNWVKDETIYGSSTRSSGRWLGALATTATRTGLSKERAIAEWEGLTGARSYDEGCNCCGRPHEFTEVDAA